MSSLTPRHPLGFLLVEGVQQAAFTRELCSQMKIPIGLFEKYELVDDVFAREQTVHAHFKAADLPPAFMQSVARVHQLLNDEFRGGIIRAAVPEMSAMLDEMFSRLSSVREPRRVRLTLMHIQSILRKIDGTDPYDSPLDLGIGRPPLG